MHNGHIYQINQVKQLCDAEAILCVLGGNFNQRGLPCVFDKHTKAQIALNNGADIVCELPSAYCVQSAEIFALSSIKLLNSIKNVTHLCFGSECGDINMLNDIASYLLYPQKAFKKQLKKYLKDGFSYAASIEKSISNDEWLDVIKKPNNLLAIEYLKALKLTKSEIIPLTIKRQDNYNDVCIADNTFISATAIRNAFNNDKLQEIKNFVPYDAFENLKKCKVDYEKLELISEYCFNIANKNIREINEVSEGIENYLKNTSSPTTRYRINKINRTKLNVMLGINKSAIKSLYKIKKLPYIKVLACNKNVLSDLSCNTNLILRKSDIIKKSKLFKQLERIDNNSNILYNLISQTKLSKSSLYEKTLFKN